LVGGWWLVVGGRSCSLMSTGWVFATMGEVASAAHVAKTQQQSPTNDQQPLTTTNNHRPRFRRLRQRDKGQDGVGMVVSSQEEASLLQAHDAFPVSGSAITQEFQVDRGRLSKGDALWAILKFD
jgi:hypothetical protein